MTEYNNLELSSTGNPDLKMRDMKVSFEALLEKLPRAPNKTFPRIVIAIDECHMLTKYEVPYEHQTLLDIVSFIINEQSSDLLSGILISSKKLFSKAQIGLPKPVSPSARFRDVISFPPGGKIYASPWVSLGFDEWIGKPIIEENTMSFPQVCNFAFLARFGRPL